MLSAARPVPATSAIGFGNRQAVRTAMLAAAVTSLLMMVPWPLAPFFLVVWLLAAGFSAVYAYNRRTGEALSMRSGVRLGWLTGVFCFLITLILTVSTALALASSGGLASLWRKQIQENAQPGLNVEQMLEVLDSPMGLSLVVIFSLGLLFLLFTTLPMIGGALGAKVLEKE